MMFSLSILEPLTADKSKSSPFIVKTYKGFTVRLMCTFKGGVAPLRIQLTRGKKLASSVEVKGRTLYFTVKTGRTARFRSYECIATDAEGIRVKQRITLRKAGKKSNIPATSVLNVPRPIAIACLSSRHAS